MKIALILVATLLSAGCAPGQTRQWKATVTVVDEAERPIADADVEMSWNVNRPDLTLTFDKTGGLTDTNGICRLSHNANGSIDLGFVARKAGYYSTIKGYELAQKSDADPAKWNPVVTLALKRIVKPVPMYVNRVDISHREKPARDKALGFDLMIGDWVSPYGKGTTAHLFFTWHVEHDTNRVANFEPGSETKLTISFPNPGDGIQEFKTETNNPSELGSSQQAPQDGYISSLVKVQSWHPDRPSTNSFDYSRNNYYLRVQTSLDENGNVTRALYGKIYGDFEQPVITYLNPEINSRNVEFDLKNNLSGKSISGWGRY